jgi:hypothetical protein
MIPYPLCACFLVALLLLPQTGCLLVPEPDEAGTRTGDIPPLVRITAGAVADNPQGSDYRAHFEWAGSDADGRVIRYQWALDDTLSPTAWHDTTGTGVSMTVTAATPRSGDPSILQDWHTFYIRAIDNELMVSRLEQRHFNATTVSPTTTITQPKLSSIFGPLGSTFTVTWNGEDVDSSRPDRKPVYYEYKLVHVSDFADIRVYRDSVRTGKNILLDTLRVGDPTRWIRVPESVRSVALCDLAPSGDNIHSYAFAVRAVDEAGATEPVLERGRNLLVFSVTCTDSGFRVLVSEPSLGSVIFPRANNTWDVTVFVGHEYRFQWVSYAACYGTPRASVNYGLDVPNPEDETEQSPNGIGGWIGWGPWQGNEAPFVFTREQANSYHYLYIYVRDASNRDGPTQRCIVRMHVVSFLFSRFALIVDDAAPNYVSDAAHDQFLDDTVFRQLYTYGQVDKWQAFGAGDQLDNPRALPEDMLVSYQNIIWNLSYLSRIRSCINATEIAGSRNLSAFLSAGGRLFICGGPVLAACEQRTNFYPHSPPIPAGESGASGTDLQEREKLWYNLLYMRNTVYSYNDYGAGRTCNPEVGGLVGARSSNPNYPDLFLDTGKWDPSVLNGQGYYRSGIREWDGFKYSHTYDYPTTLPGLDTLYTAVTWNQGHGRCINAVGSGNGSVIGWRYLSTRADTLANRQQGRTVVFDFQPWYFTRSRLTDAGTAAINWLVTGRDH